MSKTEEIVEVKTNIVFIEPIKSIESVEPKEQEQSRTPHTYERHYFMSYNALDLKSFVVYHGEAGIFMNRLTKETIMASKVSICEEVNKKRSVEITPEKMTIISIQRLDE